MNISAEPLVVSAFVLLAGVYLGRRYLLLRIRKSNKASPCSGSSCNCSNIKVKASKQ